ncbi:MAG: hypothetical protein ABS75_00970 [Pelagibacterium sp. SCN 63-23]|nr:MAG: hypothetical protein ABS75_00970 [Pelagibacterium sp. SCN 63-23]
MHAPVELQADYLDRVYAGVLGKIIGVYAGRPFEGMTYQAVRDLLGEVSYYVHDRFNVPLIVADDDIGGTFTFLRALEDYGTTPDLASEAVGKAWLNYLIEGRTILWWGGNGASTEHTAWLNLKKGISAPKSGSIEVNGHGVAEQIGAQIFIDGWALVAPAQPDLAARLAQQAARVSHDGEAVHAAMLWAAMESEAFRSADIEHVLHTGLSKIPADCLIAKLVADIRAWHNTYPDWHDTRDQIEAKYGYEHFPGSCHVVPNHALMIMTVLYAADNFHKAMTIINSSAWDTDCNAGNVGCLIGIMNGLEAFEGGPDWRGPVADQMLISSADGGNSINDAVKTAYYVANLGRKLAGHDPLPAPKDGARFHFSLPGSLQGFVIGASTTGASVTNVVCGDSRALEIAFPKVSSSQPVMATTRSFTPLDAMNMRQYDLMASPLVYPGQTLRACVQAGKGNAAFISVALRARYYDEGRELVDIDSPPVTIAPGAAAELDFVLPERGSSPIAEIGIVVLDAAAPGTVLLDYLKWDGTPQFTLSRPRLGVDYWHHAFVNGTRVFARTWGDAFHISQDVGDGLIAYGTRDWTDYSVELALTLHMGRYSAVTVRNQGMRRYYGVRVRLDQKLQIVRVDDDECTVLAETTFPVALEVAVPLKVDVFGTTIHVHHAHGTLSATDSSGRAIPSGGVGLLVCEGAASSKEIRVSPIRLN